MTAAVCAALLCSGAARADFTYEQTSKITGGAMAGMMKVAGAFSKKAREPIRSTVVVKGNKLANISTDQVQVFDLDREMITDINLEKQTYAEITFAEFQRALAEMARKMKGDGKADMKFSVDVKNTGVTRTIQGMNAQQAIIIAKMIGTDKESGQSGSMDIVMDMFVAPGIGGYKEVNDFYMRMGQKMAGWSPMSGMGMMQPEMKKGLSEAYQKMGALNGLPLLTVVRMGGNADAMVAAAQKEPAQSIAEQEKKQPAGPSAGDVAGDAAAGAAESGIRGKMGRLGGLGGLGGFGRKKKQQEEQQEQPPAQAQNPQQAGGPPPSLMEMTSEVTSFSAAPVDGSKFAVPAGFKKVQHDMEKMLKD